MFLRGVCAGTLTSIVAVLLYNQISQNGIQGEYVEQSSCDSREADCAGQEKYSQSRQATENSHILRYGAPEHGLQVLHYNDHSVGYDWVRRTPAWVAERITKDDTVGPGDRTGLQFKPDTKVPNEYSSQNSDYKYSGYARGHMSPASDQKESQAAMYDSFYLTNIVPQDMDNNMYFWNRMEMYCRDLTNRFASVQIFSGPLMLRNGETKINDRGGKYSFVTYKVIGDNEVAVPTHLYKLIIAENENGEPQGMGAFVIPNEPIGFEKDLKDFQQSLEYLESKAGVHFVPNLDASKVEDLCKVDSCHLMERIEFELYFAGRRIGSSRTVKDLNKVMQELEDKGIEPTEELTKMYNDKLKELEEKDKERRHG